MAKALIVSADDKSRYLYQMAVSFQKIEVKAVKTIKEAVQQIVKSFPDLVILDLETIKMEEMVLFKELQKKKKTLPIIIMTEMSQAEAKKQACVLGACHILAKKEASLGNLIRATRKTVGK